MLVNHVREKAAELDKSISYQVFRLGNKLKIKRQYLQLLEYSCHGIPWLILVTIVSYTTKENDFWISLLIGLLLDIVYVAVCKAVCRRRRPSYSPQAEFCWHSVDKLSFPSGHASRAVYLALIFSSDNSLLMVVSWTWALAVIVSRVLYGRHFIGDVLAGSLLGYLNFVTQHTVLYPLHSLLKWFLTSLVYETITDDHY